MVTRLKWLLILLIIGLLVYCTSSAYLPQSHHVKIAKQKWSEMDSVKLMQGYKLYKDKCGGCHRLYKPQEYDATQWPHIMYDMRFEVEMTEKEAERIRKYLLTLCCQPDSLHNPNNKK